MDKVIIDLETTGFKSTDKIIEIGMIKFNETGILDLYHQYINCLIPLTFKIEQLTGITSQMLKGFPTSFDIKSEFLGFIRNTRIYSYQAGFEKRFIKSEFIKINIIDLLAPTRKSFKLDSYKLENVSKKILNRTFKTHTALADAFTGYLIFQKIKSRGVIF